MAQLRKSYASLVVLMGRTSRKTYAFIGLHDALIINVSSSKVRWGPRWRVLSKEITSEENMMNRLWKLYKETRGARCQINGHFT